MWNYCLGLILVLHNVNNQCNLRFLGCSPENGIFSSTKLALMAEICSGLRVMRSSWRAVDGKQGSNVMYLLHSRAAHKWYLLKYFCDLKVGRDALCCVSRHPPTSSLYLDSVSTNPNFDWYPLWCPMQQRILNSYKEKWWFDTAQLCKPLQQQRGFTSRVQKWKWKGFFFHSKWPLCNEWQMRQLK